MTTIEDATWEKILTLYMAMFYLFNIPYPEGVDVALLIIQSVVFGDKVHEDDKKNKYFVDAKARYSSFVGKAAN